jgi:hypothetical protein
VKLDLQEDDVPNLSDQEKMKLYQALQHYITESNVLETLLKSTLKESKNERKSISSSPEFGPKEVA